MSKRSELHLSKKPAIKSKLTRTFEVDGKLVMVFDQVVNTKLVRDCYRYLQNNRFNWVLHDTPETKFSRRWAHTFAGEISPKILALSEKLLDLTYEHCSITKYQVSQLYSNFNLYGEVHFNHSDTIGNSPGVTTLYYANERWEIEWQGETHFCNAKGESQFVVAPRPGRVVIFDSRILHRGSPPSRICYHPRVTLAFKFYIRKKMKQYVETGTKLLTDVVRPPEGLFQ